MLHFSFNNIQKQNVLEQYKSKYICSTSNKEPDISSSNLTAATIIFVSVHGFYCPAQLLQLRHPYSFTLSQKLIIN